MSFCIPEQGTMALRADVVVTTLETGAVLLDLESKYFYSVNPSGWTVVQLFEEGTDGPRVAAACADWGLTPDQVEDVDAFAEALAAEGLIVAAEASVQAGAVDPPAVWVAPALEKHREPLHRVMVSAFDPTLPLAE